MPPSRTVLISLTGDMCIRFGEAVLRSTAFPGRQGRLMFAYLATRNRPVPRDELAEVLWPAGPPPNWKRDVSALASRLRTLLTKAGLAGPSVLVGSGGGYQLRLPDSTSLDLDGAAVRLQEATEALADADPTHALRAAQAAVAIARRPFLPGEDGEWIGGVRQELLRILLGALHLTASAYERCADIPSAVETEREVVELAPFSETAYARLIQLQLRAGNRAEALRTYHRCRHLLARELGVEPGPNVQAAYLEALRSGVGSTDAGPVPDITSSGKQSKGNLPRPVDCFIGRHAQLEAVATALGSARLVTLTGVGGVGKSRLALEVATRLAAAYPDGAWQCELSPVRAERDVTNAVAADLMVSQQPGQSPEDSVLGYLHAKRLLLVLDNCEHVLDSVRALATKVLRRCPNVSVLATSRERLGIAGEQVIDVPPLPVPAVGADSLATTSSTASVELFAVRAEAAGAGFALTPANAVVVAEICRRLDGVPLAIELAAARVATLGVTEIAARLNQRFWLLRGKAATRPARSQSLQATVDWSYSMLSAEQQQVFNRLSVFAGRFTLAAAEAACGENRSDPTHVVDAVLALADKSMVVADASEAPSRYRMLETLREYGRARLSQSGETPLVEHRHAAYFVAEAERLSQQMQGPDEALGVLSFGTCFDDIRAAHRWCIAQREADLAVRLSGALYWYGLFHQRSEVFDWADEAMVLVQGHPLSPFAYATAGLGAWVRGGRARAVALGEAAVAAAKEPASGRFALDVLGSVAFFEGRLADASALWEQALRVGQQAGDTFHASHMAGNAALAHGYDGHRNRAMHLAAIAEELAGRIGNPTALAWARYVSGEILMEDEPRRALPLLDESVRLARAVGNRFILGVALLSASSLRGRHGDPEEAIPMMLEAIRHWQHAGNWTQQWTTLRNVVELLVRLRADRPAAVLTGAIRDATTAAPVFGPAAERMEQCGRTLASRLGAQTLTALAGQGAAMEPQAVIRYALSELARCLPKQDRGSTPT